MPLVANVRADEPVPDAITSLWKDRYLRRLDLRPFDKKQSIELVGRVGRGGRHTAPGARHLAAARARHGERPRPSWGAATMSRPWPSGAARSRTGSTACCAT
ncbi:hypothetical protein [Mycobacterium servetii]|uniref:Uncharacterized protein n=1 Tax=Mycobacterium servetii TaxID=3237418 RepID=A0ABV4C8J1_9MYCO